MRNTLYLDMDGVLMDFEGAIFAHGVKRYADGAKWITKPRDQWPDEMVAADKAYVGAMALPTFWPSIQPMTDAKALWAFCASLNPRVLTAAPSDRPGEKRFAELFPVIAKQKCNSIWEHFDREFPIEHIHVCLRHEKAHFAKPGAVLVDDTPGNCEEWTAAGGIAILHKDAKTTIAQLLEIFHPKPTAFNKPALREKNSAERKAEPIHSGVMLYFPDALAAVARVSKAGNDKHNPGQPLHWARGKSIDQMDAAARHMLTLEKIDAESNETEAAHNAWRALAQLQLIEERRLADLGIRPYSGVVPC